MKIIGKSDIGKVRRLNEDSFGIREIAKGAFLVAVCDGMGGLDCGDIASKLTLDSFMDVVQRLCRTHIKDGVLSLLDEEIEYIFTNAALIANQRVLGKQEEIDVQSGMGSTLVAAMIRDNGRLISWANVGDSRFYTIDSRDILQVSKDHSYVQHMIDLGKMTLEESRRSKKRHLITKAIGLDEILYQPDVDTFALSPEERAETKIILCSDGFSDAVSEEECYAIAMDPELSLEQKADALVELAKSNDGSDNITLIIADLGED
ncbi:MAG: serine/threonine-protein phosphatase [Clostridia bacterium]|nr:serine/threonine-protein phosphatase [Clostridia bacterium]